MNTPILWFVADVCTKNSELIFKEIEYYEKNVHPVEILGVRAQPRRTESMAEWADPVHLKLRAVTVRSGPIGQA